MADPIPVPADSAPNSPNQSTFFDTIKNNQKRISRLERNSIRSGSIGGDGLSFYQRDDTTGAKIGDTAKVGEFAGYHWIDGEGWKEEPVVRGISLTEVNQDHPWWVAGNIGGQQYFQVGYGGTDVETILFKANAVWLQTPQADAYFHQTEDGSYTIKCADNGNIDLRPGPSGDLIIYNLGTAPLGLELTIDVSGGVPSLKVVSSALKYKQDIENAEIDPQDVLKMKSRTWRDKAQVESDPDTETRYIGFIADELDELPSLRQFVMYNEDGTPESIYYGRITVALLELAKAQQTQLDQQQERINDLEARLIQLESMVESIS